MKKYPLLIMSLLCFSVSLFAQYQNATEEQKKEIVNKITQVSNDMNTMLCDFTQVKELSFMDEKIASEGKMSYKKSDKIRWEYTKPQPYVFSMDGQNIHMTTGDNTKTIPAKQSKLFGEISKVMVGGVSGVGLVDSPDFDTQYFVGNTDFKVVLTPKKKEVKDFFSSVQLYIGKTDYRIRSVELVDSSGDKTAITLKNVQLNVTINDAVFSK